MDTFQKLESISKIPLSDTRNHTLGYNLASSGEKTVFGYYDQITHKSACSGTETGLGLENLNMETRRTVIATPGGDSNTSTFFRKDLVMHMFLRQFSSSASERFPPDQCGFDLN